MTTIFPGLDPFIEGQRWADFHHAFIVAIRDALVPFLRPRYEALIEERLYLQHVPDVQPAAEPASIQPIIPDVAVARVEGATGARDASVITVPVLAMPEEVRELYIEIRSLPDHEVVTVIEVLSPSNKRTGSEGRREYLPKRNSVLRTGVHLVELDLLRGGARLPMAAPLPHGDHYALVSRGNQRPLADVWAWTVRQPMPTIAIPLSGHHDDVPLDLQSTFADVYARSGYDYVLNRAAALDPPLPAADAAWATELIAGPPS